MVVTVGRRTREDERESIMLASIKAVAKSSIPLHLVSVLALVFLLSV